MQPQKDKATLGEPVVESLMDLPPAAVEADIKPTRKKLKILILGIVSIIITASLIGVSVLIWYKGKLRPVISSEGGYQVITVQQGQTADNVGRILEDKKLIRSRRAFVWYVRFQDRGQIQAGSYRLSPHQSVKQITDMLTSGKVSTLDILIPPGLRLDQIITILEKAGYKKADIEAGLSRASKTHPLLAALPKNSNPEGYIFPDTYKVSPDTSIDLLLEHILDHFQQQITSDIKAGLASQRITLKDAVILASIIQKEVPDYETQRKVAQVFIKRLKEGEPLGADPTFKYAAVMTGKPATPTLDSPYNTRIYSGLPPTPIANFNISALKAVAYPSSTKYNYFVAGDDGRTHFTYTESEHIAATKKYCTTLCE